MPVLREIRVLDAPELGASHLSIEVRSPILRASVHRGTNVTSDYGLVDRASQFVQRMSRPCLTVLLEGDGRFDEGGQHLAVSSGDIALSDQRNGGTEAYSGARSLYLALDWDPVAIGGRFVEPVAIERLGPRERERLSGAARALEGLEPERACVEIVDVLRAAGVPFERLTTGDLGLGADETEQALARALGAHLSNLRAHPAIEDLVETLGWSPRLVHRRLAASARRYGVPWEHWRALLHYQRMLSALRLLAAPGATTESVARLTGFRAPTALCHAFAKAGLPSPGTLARDARREVLEAWADHLGAGAAAGVRAA